MRWTTPILLILAVCSGACIPTAARKNARVTPGFDFDMTAGAQWLLPGEDENGQSTDAKGTVHVEADFQVARGFYDKSALAFQLKVPINIFFTSLDAYYQFPSSGQTVYFGLGAELSIAPGLYAALTAYANEALYVTFTPRVLLIDGDEFALNPQISIGVSGEIDLSVFFAFAHQTGEGLDVDIDLFGEDDVDLRKNYALAGISLRL